MPVEIGLSSERTDEGTPEERATFGLFTVKADSIALTEGFDFYINGNRQGPLVSGYHAAEWFTWNWWRLLCEPRSAANDWLFAHSLTSIGDGYVWPNITIFSDGLRTALVSSPSSRPDAKPFRYIGGTWSVVPSIQFQAALDAFIPRVIARLREENVGTTNLDRLWHDVLEERRDPEIAKRRRLEALLGNDPDAASDAAVEQLLDDARSLGEAAVLEVAADRGQHRDTADIPSAADFRLLATRDGFPAARVDQLYPPLGSIISSGSGDVAAWKVGAAAARAVREERHFGHEPIDNRTLADLAGTSADAVSERPTNVPSISFALDSGANGTRIVLRSKWATGRRFDLARLIGDRLFDRSGALHPATRANTYRQKAQRAFAAELLSPFEAVDDLMAGDYSPEKQQDVAETFDVSSLAINTLLRNNNKLPRESFDDYAAIG
jgi:hypothetical protein